MASTDTGQYTESLVGRHDGFSTRVMSSIHENAYVNRRLARNIHRGAVELIVLNEGLRWMRQFDPSLRCLLSFDFFLFFLFLFDFVLTLSFTFFPF